MITLDLREFACSFCQRPMRHWMSVPSDCKKGKPNAHSEVYWCDRCAYGAVRPLPDPEQVAEFYHLDQYYTQGVSHFEAEGKRSLFDRLRTHLAWRMDLGKPTTADTVHEMLGKRPSMIADLGCGGGKIAADLARLGHTVVGVELDPKAIAHQYRDLFQVFEGTAEALPEQVMAQKFDCVVMCHVLEHCREPSAALRNVRSILKPDGKFVCEVPNNSATALSHLGCAWEMFDVPRHLHFFTRQSLAIACEMEGLTVKETSFAHFSRQFSNSWIDTESKLWRNLMKVSPLPNPAPKENTKLNAWWLLVKTIVASPERRYDCLSVTAVPRQK